ncbi:TetR family transcriptional regulator [Cohnella sp. SGD-V74]|uniref:TetR/AcrR family transcriptional regulator n=1 Tax=unclassified Cohnella TaxID=2636738 RepID=UPI000D3FF8A3|nr:MULTISPECIES: TetR/AcrR family transcriptional regulator [unclassified Cohnella]PRX74789.1 TetR family transcriptional regulator [Cohnella sp. SGD-V74]
MNASRSKRAPGRPKSGPNRPSMRDKVLLTASVLFMELGYEPVSINMIAERAGVTKASVYYYFANKSILFTAAVTEMMLRISAVTERIIGENGSLRERLAQIALSKMTKSQAHVEFESLMREALPSLSEEQRAEIRRAEHRIHEVLAAEFARAMESGEIPPGHPMLLSHAFSALLMIGSRERIGEEEFAPERLAAAVVDLFLNGAGGK